MNTDTLSQEVSRRSGWSIFMGFLTAAVGAALIIFPLATLRGVHHLFGGGEFVMTTALWIAQGVAAVVFLLTGTLKLVTPKEKLAGKMHWAATWPAGRIKLLGLAEVAGAIGLVVPAASHIAPLLTPIAAVCLAVLMLGAVQTHRRLHESFAPALALALVCVGIAAGRMNLMG